jgi:CheY-like chemotaxis protein
MAGADAIRAIERMQFAVVLLDVQMPDLDGYATARQIEKRPNGRNVPIALSPSV